MVKNPISARITQQTLQVGNVETKVVDWKVGERENSRKLMLIL